MGTCGQKRIFYVSTDEHLEYINIIKGVINELEEYVISICNTEPNYKMSRYLLILNCIKQIKPILDLIEKGKIIYNEEVKQSLENLFFYLKEYNKAKYEECLLKFKQYF